MGFGEDMEGIVEELGKAGSLAKNGSRKESERINEGTGDLVVHGDDDSFLAAVAPARPEHRGVCSILILQMETLKRHLPVSGQEGLEELKKIAIRFEEKIYSAATSQSDYLRKISLKMLTMESKSQNTLPNAMPSNAAGVSRNPQDQGTSIKEGIIYCLYAV
ncbi:hypothetical protein Cgig2_014405 [Carnegiea gigantea]|uniref:Mediator complex subunit 15 KIX domain-containing protein n=1 Tax=Carnegiea gigantea TaxID=171969 RepID=A0A9Q1GTW2_9CARY|nr:hypothetical protein Cgig2_014405 [Carnegiea gigantea]